MSMGFDLATMMGDRRRSMHPHIKEWTRKSRLSPSSWLAQHKGHPKVTEGYEAIKKHGAKAAGNLANLLANT